MTKQSKCRAARVEPLNCMAMLPVVLLLSGCGSTSAKGDDASDTGWSQPLLLNASQAGEIYAPQIAMNEAGQALVVWTEVVSIDLETRGAVWASSYLPGEGWQPPDQVSEGQDSGSPRVEMDERGDALVVWVEQGGVRRVVARRLSADAGWGDAEVLRDDPAVEPRFVNLAMNAHGQAVAVWTDTSVAKQVQAKFFDPSTGWGKSESIGGSSDPNAPADIGLNAAGQAVALWSHFVEQVPNSEYTQTVSQMYQNRFEPEAGWGGAQPAEGLPGAAPDIAVQADGGCTALWMPEGHPSPTVWLGRADSANHWVGEMLHGGSWSARMAVADDGRAVVAVRDWGW